MAEKSKPAASVVQVEEVDDDDEDDDDEVTAVDGAGLTAVDCAGFSNMSTSSMAEKSKPTTSVVQGEEVDDEDDDDEGTAVDGAGLLPNKGTAVDGAGFSNMSTSLMAEKSKPAASVVQVEEVDDEDDDDKGTAVDGAGLLPNKGTAVDGAVSPTNLYMVCRELTSKHNSGRRGCLLEEKKQIIIDLLYNINSNRGNGNSFVKSKIESNIVKHVLK
jgi:hypothetical protein